MTWKHITILSLTFCLSLTLLLNPSAHAQEKNKKFKNLKKRLVEVEKALEELNLTMQTTQSALANVSTTPGPIGPKGAPGKPGPAGPPGTSKLADHCHMVWKQSQTFKGNKVVNAFFEVANPKNQFLLNSGVSVYKAEQGKASSTTKKYYSAAEELEPSAFTGLPYGLYFRADPKTNEKDLEVVAAGWFTICDL